MADITSNIDKMTDDEIAFDKPLSESLFIKLGANINQLADAFIANASVLTGSGTWTVPAGITRALVFAVGGGGGGGGGVSSSGSATGSDGGAGGASTFNSVTVAEGGRGGGGAFCSNNISRSGRSSDGGGSAPGFDSGAFNFGSEMAGASGIIFNGTARGGGGAGGGTAIQADSSAAAAVGGGGGVGRLGFRIFTGLTPGASIPYAAGSGGAGGAGVASIGSNDGSSGSAGALLVIPF